MYKAYSDNRQSVPHTQPRMDVPIDDVTTYVSGQIIVVPWYSSSQNAEGRRKHDDGS